MTCSACGKEADALTTYVSPYQPGPLHLCPPCAEKWSTRYGARPAADIKDELRRELAARYSRQAPAIDEVLKAVVNGYGMEPDIMAQAQAIRGFLMKGE